MASGAQVTVEDLLAGARNGDTAQRDRLFEACRPYLGLVARTQVDGWLQAKVDASDLVQQTMLEAYRDFYRFQGHTEAEWLAWLRRILSHNAADLVRQFRGTDKRQARREIPLQQPGSDSQSPRAAEPLAREATPSQQLLMRDRDLQMAAALEGLPPDYREVIVLRNLERLPFEDVAARMGRSRPAVQMLWGRAIKKLQETLVI